MKITALVIAALSAIAQSTLACEWVGYGQPAAQVIAPGDTVSIMAGATLAETGQFDWLVVVGIHLPPQAQLENVAFTACDGSNVVNLWNTFNYTVQADDIVDGRLGISQAFLDSTGEFYQLSRTGGGLNLTASSGDSLTDLLAVINNWGFIGAPGQTAADFSLDGVTEVNDLMYVINHWN